MDEKTRSLRDLFMNVAERETLTERQQESPGTLTGDHSREQRVYTLIGEMRDRFGIAPSLDDDALLSIARGHFADNGDAAIATELGVDEDDVTRARLQLHLVSDADRDLAVDPKAIRRAVADGADVADLAERFDADVEVLERAYRVAIAEREMRRNNYRFRDELSALLDDGDLSERLTAAGKETGLEDATEGLETNTSF